MTQCRRATHLDYEHRLLCSGPPQEEFDAASQGCFLVFKFPGDVFSDEEIAFSRMAA
jgi:hypothetical protein